MYQFNQSVVLCLLSTSFTVAAIDLSFKLKMSFVSVEPSNYILTSFPVNWAFERVFFAISFTNFLTQSIKKAVLFAFTKMKFKLNLC